MTPKHKYIGTVHANGTDHRLYWPGPGCDICAADGTPTETGIYDTYADAVADAHRAWDDWVDDPNA